MFTPVGEGVTFERFIVQCMNLIKMIVKNDSYKPAKNIDGKTQILWKEINKKITMEKREVFTTSIEI